MKVIASITFFIVFFVFQCGSHAFAFESGIFSRLPMYQDVKLSPDGNRIVFVENVEKHGTSVLSFFNVETGVRTLLFQSDNRKIKLNWHRWKTNDILLVSVRYASKKSGVRFYRTKLFSVDVSAEQNELRPLLKKRLSKPSNQIQDRIVHWLPDDPEHILMQADLKAEKRLNVYRVNVNTGKAQLIERGKLGIANWTADTQGNIRIGRGKNLKNGLVTYWYRDSEDDDLDKLFEYHWLSDKSITVLGFGKDPKELYFLKYDGNYKALYRMNLKSKTSTQLLKHDGYDVSRSLIVSPQTQDVIGIYDAQSPFGRFYFDKKHYALHKAMQQAIPDKNNHLVSISDDGKYYIMLSESDSSPGVFYFGDRNKKTLQALFEQYPEIQTMALPKHKSITYIARDGVEIQGYLTLPLIGNAPYPTVIHPHGGPGTRDKEGFDPWVAYLVSKGYAVMRPNFRGSTGFGYEFAQAQMGRWGLEMQDDITDAANYLFDQGIANKERICIFGASYGGYAAKMATVKTPDLFTCAVSFAGVSDLRLLKNQLRQFVGGELIAEEQLGKQSKDLKRRSPIEHVEKIKTPLLVMHGIDDAVVHIQQSRFFVDKLKQHNKKVTYVEFDQGDHYLSVQNNRHLFFKELDAFLTTHLGSVAP